MNSIWNRIRSLRYISMPLFLMRLTTENYEFTHRREFWTHEIPTRKYFRLSKYPRENIFYPRNTHEKKVLTHEIPTKARWHDGTRPTRPTIARDPRNLPQSTMTLLKPKFQPTPLTLIFSPTPKFRPVPPTPFFWPMPKFYRPTPPTLPTQKFDPHHPRTRALTLPMPPMLFSRLDFCMTKITTD